MNNKNESDESISTELYKVCDCVDVHDGIIFM